jgi:hypothetical protein
MRRSQAVGGISFVVLVALGATVALYAWLRIPPQRSGDDWRVLGRPSFGIDASTFTPEVTDTSALLPEDRQPEPDEVALAVVIDSGDHQYVRITDVEFAAPVVKLDVHRYTGLSGGDDAILMQDIYVLAVSRDRMAGVTMVQVDDLPPVALKT